MSLPSTRSIQDELWSRSKNCGPLADGFLVLTPKGVIEDFAPDLA